MAREQRGRNGPCCTEKNTATGVYCPRIYVQHKKEPLYRNMKF